MSMTAERFVHYKTDIDDMDKQHWELFTAMDTVAKCLKKQDCDNISDKVLLLVKLMSDHFKYEHSLMADSNYPYATAHNAAHADQMARIHALHGKSKNNESFSPTYISDIAELLVKHVDEHDLQLARFLHNHSLTTVAKPAIIAP